MYSIMNCINTSRAAAVVIPVCIRFRMVDYYLQVLSQL
jgi:hypothetical protein